MKKFVISQWALAVTMLAVALIALLLLDLLPQLSHLVQTIGMLFFPGLCIVSVSRLNPRRLTRFFVVAIAFSVAADLIVYGAVDMVALATGPRDLLTVSRLTAMQSIFETILALIVFKAGNKVELQIPRRITARDAFLLCCSTSALIVACVGALILNNGGNGDWALISYGLVGITFVAMISLKDTPTPEAAEAALVILGLALLFSNALRSSYISAADINYEYQIASMVQARGVWDPLSFNDAFMACLSSSFLPVVISGVSGLALMTVFKVVMPILFACIVILVVDLARLFTEHRGAIAAGFVFIAQPAFQQWVSIPVRVEVAFLMFALALWTLLVPEVTHRNRVVLFWISCTGMVLSHYTTTYIACFLFAVTLFVKQLTLMRARRRENSLMRARTRERSLPRERYLALRKTTQNFSLSYGKVLNWMALVIVTGAALAWYGPITTHGAPFITDYAVQTAESLPKMFDPSVQAQGQSALSGFGLFSSGGQTTTVSQYVSKATAAYQVTYGTQSILAPASASAAVHSAQLTSLPAHKPWSILIPLLRSFAKVFALLLIAVGAIVVLRRRRPLDFAQIFALSAVLSVLILVLIPFVSVDYDLDRLFQQFLLLMAPLMVIGAITLWRRPRRYKSFLGGALIVLYFALLSRAAFQLGGGSAVSMTFNNVGADFENYYVSGTDASAGQWLAAQWDSATVKPSVYADQAGSTRLRLVVPVGLSREVKLDVLPSTFIKGSYLFLDSANISTGIMTRVYNGQEFQLSISLPYFNEHLNRVYSTSDTAIYTGG